MNKLIDYVRVLNPVNERKDIVSAVTQLQEELNQNTLPTAKDLQEVFVGHSFKSAYMTSVTKELRKRVVFQGSVLDVIVQSLDALSANLPMLEKEVKRLFSFQFSRDNLTYKRVNLMRYIESAHFYVRYVRKLMLRLVAEEALAVGSATPMSWARAELEWINEGLHDFAALYPAIAQPESKLKQTLAAVSDATIEEATFATAEQSIGQRGMDPMRLANFSPTRNNPFFSFGKMLAEWKVKNYQGAKEEHQALQLRMQELRELKTEGKTNPKLQKLIQHTEQRIEQLDYKIAKIEEAHQYD